MSLKKAAHLTASIQFLDYLEAPLNITGATVLKFMLKRSDGDLDANALITKTLSAGVTITGASTGEAEAALTAADLETIPSAVYAEAMVIVGGVVVRTATYYVTFVTNVIKAIT